MEERRKVAETNKKAAIEERHRANQLAQQLEDNKTSVEAPAVLPDKNMNCEIAIMKLQRKKLKFKKKQGFVQFSHRLDVLNNYFSHWGEDWQRL
ncbi:hypothetical protein CsSME_00019789 [Camellia sinensis var. sinensis]